MNKNTCRNHARYAFSFIKNIALTRQIEKLISPHIIIVIISHVRTSYHFSKTFTLEVASGVKAK